MLLIFLLKPNLSNKKKIDRSTLYSLVDLFKILPTDVSNLEFLGKSAVDFKHCLLFFDLFTSKVYICPIKWRKFLAKKISEFYEEVDQKR